MCDRPYTIQHFRGHKYHLYLFTYIFPWLLVAGACMYSILANLTGQCMSVDFCDLMFENKNITDLTGTALTVTRLLENSQR